MKQLFPFWFFASIVIYVYFGYPFLLIVLSRFKNNELLSDNDSYPFVSLIIAAYNEEKSIQMKIENSLSLDYPKNKLKIIVASDGSTDTTNRIVEKYHKEGVLLVSQELNRGKSSIQNEAAKVAKGEILLFSDANAFLRKNALKKIIDNFCDEKVGCVVGKVSYLNEGDSSVGEGEGAYWRYELFLRKKESDIGNLAMGSGPIMALRKKLYSPLNSNVGEDFVLPMQVVLQGYKVVYEPEAISEETLYQTKSNDMFKTKVRIISKDLRGLFSCAAILNPFKYPLYSLGLISHKLLRWLVPYFLIPIFIINLFLLNKPFYVVLFILQIIFYSLAGIGYLFERNGWKNSIVGIPFSFCIVNFASFIGVWKYFTGQKSGRWEPIR